MNIVYLANLRLPTDKAHGFQIIKMCEALAKNGSGVELVVPWRKNEISEGPFDYWGIKKIFSVKKIGIIDFAASPFLSSLVGFSLNSLYFSLVAFRYLLFNRRFQYIYTRDRELIWLPIFLRKPFIFEIHVLPRIIQLHKFFWKKAEKIIVITEYLKVSLVKLGIPENKILVLADAVDLEQFDISGKKNEFRKKIGLPITRKIIVYAGQLYSWKGVEVLVRATNYLDDSFLVVIVGGWQKEISKLETLPHKNTNFVGQKSIQEIPLWLKAADILALPNSARYAISRHYTSPMKLFEYMAVKVPIASSDLPSIKEILTDKEAEFFQPDDPKDLARAIKDIINDKKRASGLAAAAYLKVQNYTWDKRAVKIISELGKL